MTALLDLVANAAESPPKLYSCLVSHRSRGEGSKKQGPLCLCSCKNNDSLLLLQATFKLLLVDDCWSVGCSTSPFVFHYSNVVLYNCTHKNIPTQIFGLFLSILCPLDRLAKIRSLQVRQCMLLLSPVAQGIFSMQLHIKIYFTSLTLSKKLT